MGRKPVSADFVAKGDVRRAEGPSTCVDGANISSPKATKSRAVGPFTTNNGPKARLRTFRCYFVAEGDEIAGRRRRRRNHGPKARTL